MTTLKHEQVPATYRLSPQHCIEQYQKVRQFTEYLCQPLVTEDYVIQSMPDVSPTKWHLAHVSWFFETFLLKPALPGYQSLHPQYAYLFNSYYVTVGDRHCRQNRGLLSRPTVAEVYDYRAHVDRAAVPQPPRQRRRSPPGSRAGPRRRPRRRRRTTGRA